MFKARLHEIPEFYRRHDSNTRRAHVSRGDLEPGLYLVTSDTACAATSTATITPKRLALFVMVLAIAAVVVPVLAGVVRIMLGSADAAAELTSGPAQETATGIATVSFVTAAP